MSNHLIQGLAGTAVPKRLPQLLLLAVALFGTGASIVALSRGVPARHPVVNASVAPVVPNLNIDDAPTLLPAIMVRPEVGITTLATITVHPDRAGAEARAPERGSDVTVGAKKADDPGTDATISLAGGSGFDMPYYSFGRSPRHASKE